MQATACRGLRAPSPESALNLVLFDPDELDRGLPIDDPRCIHIKRVLRRGIGEPFDCGLINGARGRAAIVVEESSVVRLAFTWGEKPPPLDPITLLIGLPRPQTARKILAEMSAVGVARMFFFTSAKGERSYASSSLWSSGEVRRHLIAGAQQAFCTLLPDVVVFPELGSAIAAAGRSAARIALDNYEGVSLAKLPLDTGDATLAVGPERGWDSAERQFLRQSGFTLAHLGVRVLRSETACVAATTLLKARLGLL
ncbi:MAG TPA: RsmE family RNA methyltransferase [Opitutaceae bacterium]